ncbi:MAG: hypothetical protein ACK58T_25615, partial [Phycisphaerae bacterium]
METVGDSCIRRQPAALRLFRGGGTRWWRAKPKRRKHGPPSESAADSERVPERDSLACTRPGAALSTRLSVVVVRLWCDRHPRTPRAEAMDLIGARKVGNWIPDTSVRNHRSVGVA